LRLPRPKKRRLLLSLSSVSFLVDALGVTSPSVVDVVCFAGVDGVGVVADEVVAWSDRAEEGVAIETGSDILEDARSVRRLL
jgi:hypothetical protein